MVVIYITVIVTQSGNIEKIIENLKTDNVVTIDASWMQHGLGSRV